MEATLENKCTVSVCVFKTTIAQVMLSVLSLLYYFLLSSTSRWYVIIFIFNLFITFLLPHHDKGKWEEKADILGYSFH